MDIGIVGLAINQAVSLFNYIECLTASASNSNVLQLALRATTGAPSAGASIPVEVPNNPNDPNSGTTTVYYWFEACYDGQGLGQIAAGETITVTGHSMGGHLAALAARLFPGLVSEAYTYNAPGFDPLSSSLIGIPPEQLTDEFVALFGDFLVTPPATSFSTVTIHGAESEDIAPGDDVSIVTGFFTGTASSNEVSIATEKNSHGIGQLVDSLGLQALLASMNGDLSLADMTVLYRAASNEIPNTQETLLGALHKLFLGEVGALSQVEAGTDLLKTSDGEFSARVTNTQRLVEVEEAVKATSGLLLNNLASNTSATYVSVAGQDDAEGLSVRYALRELNPFGVVGADYTSHNAEGTLDLYDPATGQGQITGAWIADRATLLVKLNAIRTEDIAADSGGVFRLDPTGNDSVRYTDVASDLAMQVGQTVLDPRRIVFGDDNDNTVRGGILDDHLYGGNGSDILEGKASNDYLEGGLGADTYRIGASDGIDTILDVDGQGNIAYSGVALHGGYCIAPNQWQDSQGNVYALAGTGNGGHDLLIDAGDTHLIVKDHQDGELGIHLGGEVAPTAFVQSGNGITVVGDRMPYQMPWNYWLWLANPTWPYLFDSNGNIVRTGVAQPFYADKIYDTAGDDTIQAGDGLNVIYAYNGGNNQIVTGVNDDYIMGGGGRDRVFAGGMTDVISVGAGDDIVYGEDGRDVIDAGAGNDFVAGGSGADAIHGGAGDDQIYAGDSIAWEHALADGGNAVAGPGELLAGGAGTDVLVGAATDDVLLGGEDGDLIAGGAGDDILLGDADLAFSAPALSEFDPIINAARWPMGPYLGYHSPFTVAPMLNIQVDRVDHGTASLNRYEAVLSSLQNPEAPRDNWIVAASVGNEDQLRGGSGNDWLFGEFGDDILDGGTDNDYLDGGVGNDTFIFYRGSGQDVACDVDATSGNTDCVLMTDIASADVSVSQAGLDLLIAVDGTDDLLNLSNWFYSADTCIEQVIFTNGVVWGQAELIAASQGLL